MFGNVSGDTNTATTSLTTIDLSATQVTQLPNNLFQGCTSLSNVKLPAGLTNIGNNAFQNTTSLKTIDIPSSVTSIGDSAFGSGNASEASGITALDLSQTKITNVPNNMVRNCAGLTDMKLPAGVANIGDNAFNGTTSLKTIDIPSSVTTINQGAFASSAITALDLSKTALTSIANSTFNGATKLETVKLPSTVTSIGQSAFQGTTALKNLTQEAPAASETPGSRAAGNQLASTLTSIGTRAFQGTGLESIDLSLTGITTGLGNSAFQNAANLSSVTLPKTLTAISAASFAGTVKLMSIVIPSSVNRINAGNSDFLGAFQGSGLESIDLSGTGITGKQESDQPGS